MSMNALGQNTSHIQALDVAGRIAADTTSPARAAGEPSTGNRVPEGSEVPRGTDPGLWRVLSPGERDRFARAGAMGPLTYGYLISSGRSDLPIVRGGRLDVKA